MGVGRAGGRAEGGGWGLTSPPREEPVDLPSAHSAQELRRRLDARMDGRWSELYGRGISVRREPNGYRLTPRTQTMWTPRPRAVVRVVPEGDRARLTGVIRRTPGGHPVVNVLSIPLTVAVLTYWAMLGGAGLFLFGVAMLVAGLAAGPVRLRVQHNHLWELLDEIVAP